MALVLIVWSGCVRVFPPDGRDGTDQPTYANTTDAANDGATDVGTAACSACHPSVGELHADHGHAAAAQCEACHGPGSNHIPNPSARDLFVGVGAQNCGRCHARGDTDVIAGDDGFIGNLQQWSELLASGGHADFDCIICHAPHVSARNDRENGIRNDCTDCHTDQNLGSHEGYTYVSGDNEEDLTCQSCHMPLATKAAGGTVEQNGRIGDRRTHIFRVNTEPVDYTEMFAGQDGSVQKDEAGLAAVTVDFVCLRCHNGSGNAFPLPVSAAASLAAGFHEVEEEEPEEEG